MRKMKPEEKKVPISVAFDQDILSKLEDVRIRKRMSRSSYINIAIDRILIMEENKMGLSS